MILDRLGVQELIDDVFEEEARLLGGMVAIGEVDDDLVWCLVRNFDLIRDKALRRLQDEVIPGSPPPIPHPAIQDFLLSLGRA